MNEWPAVSVYWLGISLLYFRFPDAEGAIAGGTKSQK